MEDTTLSRQQSEEHLDQGDRVSSAFTNRDNLCSYISFNETTWWVFERATIARVCVLIMCKGTTETREKESLTCSTSEGYCCGGRTPPPEACRWLAGGAAPLVVKEKLATTVVESIEERRGEGRLQGEEGERSSDGRRLSYQVENN